jgi:signal transduction histidine kinase
MMTWRSVNLDSVEFFDKLSIVGIIVPAIFLYFSYVFPDEKNISMKKAMIIFLPLLPFIFLAATSLNIKSINSSTSDCESVVGPLYYLIPLIFILYCVWSVVILFTKFRNGNEQAKKQIKLVLVGFVIFIVWATITNVVAQLVGPDSLSFFGPIGAIIFMSFVAYAIVKYQLLSIKLIAAQALTVVIWILVASQYFFTDSTTNIILITFTLLLSIGFGIMLVKSVKLEVKRKEELQQMSDKLSEANDQLRKLDNSKSEFISIASHQLRTPLTAIKGFVSLLLEGSYGQVVPKQQDVLNKVYTSNERLVTLVEDLLNISRMESGRMEFKFAPWNMETVCQEVMDTFIQRAKFEKKSLEFKKPEIPLPEVMIDGTKVREVISNMVDNALKYTPKGGVTLKVEQADASRYTPNKNGDIEDKPIVGPVIRVTVSDTGIGIPVTELPYLFAKFSRGKDVSRLNTGGTGLGLYVGRSMIENNGGKIWAESDGEGQGSRFIIEIPMHQSKELMERWG